MSPPLRQRPLSLDGLRSFEAVARHASFSQAADELHLTQSAVSRQIKALEEELGAALFVRGARRVDLTADGRLLLRNAIPLLHRLDATVRHIRLNRHRAQVNLGTFSSFSSLWLLPRLGDFEQQYPQTDIRIAASDAMVSEDEAELDLALRHCLPERAPPAAIRLFGEVLTPVVSRELYHAIQTGQAPALQTPADLEHHTLLDMDDGSMQSVEQGWANWLALHGHPMLSPRRWLRTNYTHQQMQAALAGHGVALARLGMVHDRLTSGELVEPLGTAHRRWTRWCYWLVPLGGAWLTADKAHSAALRAPLHATTHPGMRPEVGQFIDWVQTQAAATRLAIADTPDPELDAHCD